MTRRDENLHRGAAPLTRINALNEMSWGWLAHGRRKCERCSPHIIVAARR